MAEVAAGGWHSVCVSETGDIYIWGWNESGQLALPTRNLAEDGETVAREATGLNEDGSQVKRTGRVEDGAPAPFIAVQPFPALLDLPLGSDAVKVSCGSRHTAVVTRTGELYTWGWDQPTQKVTGDKKETPHCIFLKCLKKPVENFQSLLISSKWKCKMVQPLWHKTSSIRPSHSTLRCLYPKETKADIHTKT
ncbi:RCC1 domain-containing protein 1 isoform X9 [Macaca fascicularis]